jgi:hypothetical protein
MGLFLQESPYLVYLLHLFPSQWVDKEEKKEKRKKRRNS